MRTLIFETDAWVIERELHRVFPGAQHPATATTYSMFDFDASKMGYVKVGRAVLTVELMDERDLRESTANSLRSQIEKVRAESQNAITELTRKLNEVLAIECDAELA